MVLQIVISKSVRHENEENWIDNRFRKSPQAISQFSFHKTANLCQNKTKSKKKNRVFLQKKNSRFCLKLLIYRITSVNYHYFNLWDKQLTYLWLLWLVNCYYLSLDTCNLKAQWRLWKQNRLWLTEWPLRLKQYFERCKLIHILCKPYKVKNNA